jgi:1-deoxy-D-xylulose-5-phosphate reductoisomerase
MHNITLLGSTGSIGVSTLQVLALHPERFNVFALTAHQNVQAMLAQCIAFQPRYAVMSDTVAAEQLESLLKKQAPQVTVLAGAAALIEVAGHSAVDYVMAGIVGAAGLLPTLTAAQAGKRVLLANKEALVMSGKLFIDAIQQNNATLIPVDSEHSAIFQCLPSHFKTGHAPLGVKQLTLTASGGAFRDWRLEDLHTVTPQQACQHPNWNMGAKITVDSATMMNKGLEVIEAHWLFGMPPEQIDTILHPQSIVHSWVEYMDSSIVAQLGQPDMRTPIAYALSWPERMTSDVPALNLVTIGRLDFQPINAAHYPCLKLAYTALKAGGTATTILNAANEIAVQAFLEQKIRFTDIFKVVEQCLETTTMQPANSLAVILAADELARSNSWEIIHRHR